MPEGAPCGCSIDSVNGGPQPEAMGLQEHVQGKLQQVAAQALGRPLDLLHLAKVGGCSCHLPAGWSTSQPGLFCSVVPGYHVLVARWPQLFASCCCYASWVEAGLGAPAPAMASSSKRAATSALRQYAPTTAAPNGPRHWNARACCSHPDTVLRSFQPISVWTKQRLMLGAKSLPRHGHSWPHIAINFLSIEIPRVGTRRLSDLPSRCLGRCIHMPHCFALLLHSHCSDCA